MFRRDADGFYYFVGRTDDMFVSGGENIYPADVERMLERHPDVAQAAVVPIDDEIKGQKPVAFVIREPGRALDADDDQALRARQCAGLSSIRASSGSSTSCRSRPPTSSTARRCTGWRRSGSQRRQMAPFAPGEIDRRLPVGDEIFLDHVGHFVPDAEAASRALAHAGFAPTPVSIQTNPDPASGVRPTGTGNVTAMLDRGYLEVLFKTADTALGREFDAALARYPGLHLAAFAVADAVKARMPAGDGGLSRAAAGRDAAPGRDRRRHRHGGVHDCAGRARRDAGGPHPDADASHRAHGVAAALARASQHGALA